MNFKDLSRGILLSWLLLIFFVGVFVLADKIVKTDADAITEIEKVKIINDKISVSKCSVNSIIKNISSATKSNEVNQLPKEVTISISYNVDGKDYTAPSMVLVYNSENLKEKTTKACEDLKQQLVEPLSENILVDYDDAIENEEYDFDKKTWGVKKLEVVEGV